MKIKPTETVTLGEKTYVVKTLPEGIKSLVEVYDDVRKDNEAARVEYIKCQAALKELGNQIAGEMAKWEEEMAAEAQLDEIADE